MSTAQEIETAIKSLPREEMTRLWQWWDTYCEAAWDRQIESDSEAGNLDKLLKEADADFDQGRCTPIQ